MLSIPNILQLYHPEPLPFLLGKCIGQGNQGIVYEDLNDPNKVIKLCLLYDDFGTTTLDDRFVGIENAYKHIIENPHTSLVKVFEFNKLYKGSQFIFEWEQTYILYYSIMQTLDKLSENEEKAFKTICDTYNKEVKTERPIETIIKELKEWLEFDDVRVLSFYNSLADLKIHNGDFQPRNVMKDKENNYCLIDFDLAKLKEKEDVKGN